VDVHARLREVVVEDQPERVLERLALRRVERDAEVPCEVPVGEQVELAAQELLVVGRQLALARAFCQRTSASIASR
jgi:hypothetical protein